MLFFSGFGFYPVKDWEEFKSKRIEVGPGKNNDEAVCLDIGMAWIKQHPEDSQDYCMPQWDGFSCIPSAPINQSAVLPCMEFVHDSEGQKYFDTSCE